MEFISADPRKPFMLYASHKVMTSTLGEMPTLRPVSYPVRWDKSLVWNGKRLWQNYGPAHGPRYLLVRHPFARLESLYRHLYQMETQADGEELRQAAIHNHFRIILDSLKACHGKDQGQSLLREGQLLQATPFEKWVLSLESFLENKSNRRKFLRRELHSQWQHLALHPKITRLIPHLPLQIKCDRILRLEDAKDRDFAEKTLGIDWRIHKNRTKGIVSCPTPWTDKMRTIIYRLYFEDFKRFHYRAEDWTG